MMIDKVPLGQTGLEVSPLCFGTGTHGWNGRSDQSDLGSDALPRLLRFAHDYGITFWDTADQYGTHAHVADAMAEIGRDRVTIATKSVSRTAADIEADVERYLRELRTDYIDILLLHCMSDANWPQKMRGPMERLDLFKEKGIVRAVGCSCHDLGALQASAEADWVDVNLVRINYAGQNMCAEPARVQAVIERMVAEGKGVYGMKVVGGGGDLTADPEKAIRFVCEHTPVHALVMGLVSEEQVIENSGLVAEAVAQSV
jgi:aryl-alcohol dehydrogenase-like predicted oxidoreductase